MPPVNKASTYFVFLNLFKDRENTFEPVGTQFTTTTQEEYVKEAMAWLGDKSELADSTLRTADWQEIYEYFKKEQGAQ